MLLDNKRLSVKGRSGVVGLSYAYDILNPDTQEVIGYVREETGSAAKGMRLVLNNALLPVTISVRETEDGPPLLTIHRSPYMFRPTFKITDSAGESAGRLKGGTLFSRSFEAIDPQNTRIARLKVNWTGVKGELVNDDGMRFGTLERKWSKNLKERMNLAGQYEITVEQEIAARRTSATILLAGALALDVVARTRVRA
jgi:uncharacterized protein YxjI